MSRKQVFVVPDTPGSSEYVAYQSRMFAVLSEPLDMIRSGELTPDAIRTGESEAIDRMVEERNEELQDTSVGPVSSNEFISAEPVAGPSSLSDAIQTVSGLKTQIIYVLHDEKDVDVFASVWVDADIPRYLSVAQIDAYLYDGEGPTAGPPTPESETFAGPLATISGSPGEIWETTHINEAVGLNVLPDGPEIVAALHYRTKSFDGTLDIGDNFFLPTLAGGVEVKPMQSVGDVPVTADVGGAIQLPITETDPGGEAMRKWGTIRNTIGSLRHSIIGNIHDTGEYSGPVPKIAELVTGDTEEHTKVNSVLAAVIATEFSQLVPEDGYFDKVATQNRMSETHFSGLLLKFPETREILEQWDGG